MIVNIILAVVALVGWVCCYVNAHRLKVWAEFCQEGRIVIAYKRKAVLQAPLTEWVLWARQLNKDEQSAGRMIFHRAGVSVAIAKGVPTRRKRPMLGMKKPNRPDGTQQVTKGRFKATDETPKENHLKAVN